MTQSDKIVPSGPHSRRQSGGSGCASLAVLALGLVAIWSFSQVAAAQDGASTEADILVTAVMTAPETPAHQQDAGKALEHDAVLSLLPRAEATHVAIASGSWFEASTWHQDRIPDAGARVLIPAGLSVSYDGQNDAPLFTVRVDGEVRFGTDVDSRIVVDTMFIAPDGRLEIGTAHRPMNPDVSAEILIANTGDIDIARDPFLLSRGFISHGSVAIHGARKTAFLKVASAPLLGATQIALAAVPEGWRVGDTVVVSGTLKRGWAWNNDLRRVVYHPTQDEVRTITAIDRHRIMLDQPLSYDHSTPRADLFAYVANMTRNVVIASQSGPGTPVGQRGHVMFMHSDDVDVRYAAFNDLGRTDKSREAFDISALVKVSGASNIKGRYSFHLHRTGLADPLSPAIAVGNTVSGSPGWGFVQHSSHADFIDNVAFNVFGAAFAAEDGNETGIWLRNMAILSQGFAPGSASAKMGYDRHDNGRTGDGFFFAGRLVEAAENVAVNTTHGFVWMHRSAPAAPEAATLDQPEISYGAASVLPPEPPIQGFRNNEAFGTEVGLMIIKSSPAQGHDVRSVLDGFLNWETWLGVDISYSGHYSMRNFDLVGTRSPHFFAPEGAITFGTNAFGITLQGLRIAHFKKGVDLSQGFTFEMPAEDVAIDLIDVEMIKVAEPYLGFDARKNRLLTSADVTEGVLEFEPAAVTLGGNQDLSLVGIKTDSIGSIRREVIGDPQTIYRWEVPDLLKSVGYYSTAEGQLIALVPDLVADRVTGRLKKFSYLVVLAMTEAELTRLGAPYHGKYDAADRAPVTARDTARTAAGQAVRIDVLANDADPEGGSLSVQGSTDPVHGEIFRQDDGTLLYLPYDGFTGTDSFTYWAGDGMGNYTPETVRVEVTRS